jgi:hypothetical protein
MTFQLAETKMQSIEPSNLLVRPCPGTLQLSRKGFDADEEVYRRIPPSKVNERGRPKAQCFDLDRFPLSVNRSKFSSIECALCLRSNNFQYPVKPGPVMKLRVADIAACGIRLEHEPTWMNYSHSELRVREDPLTVTSISHRLSELATVVRVEQLPQSCNRCTLDPLCLHFYNRLQQTATAIEVISFAGCDGTCDLRMRCHPPANP